MTTKERIIFEALDLFSMKGYEAVSMRDLAAKVGIQQSSIYKHYPNKQSIMDAITCKVIEEIDKMFIEMKVPDEHNKEALVLYSKMEISKVVEMCTKMLIGQMSNEWINKFRQIATIEQYRSDALNKQYHELFIDKQLGYIEQVFEVLIEQKIFISGNVKQMALAFFAPFFMLQYRYPDDKEELQQKLKLHIKYFINEHIKEE